MVTLPTPGVGEDMVMLVSPPMRNHQARTWTAVFCDCSSQDRSRQTEPSEHRSELSIASGSIALIFDILRPPLSDRTILPNVTLLEDEVHKAGDYRN